MATSQLFLILAILAIFAPSILAMLLATTKGGPLILITKLGLGERMFYVGDNLVFNYPKGAHNVFKVNGTGFQECSAPLDSEPLTSGKDVINLVFGLKFELGLKKEKARKLAREKESPRPNTRSPGAGRTLSSARYKSLGPLAHLRNSKWCRSAIYQPKSTLQWQYK